MQTFHRNPSYPCKVIFVFTALLALILSPLGIHPAIAAGAWQTVGPAGFSVGMASSTSLAIDSSGTPYVAYMDGANDFKATVMKYDGTNWVPVGPVGFSADMTSSPSLAIDGSDTLYVAYRDWAVDGRATVMKFDGMNWVPVGSAGFSAGTLGSPVLVFDDSGTPYLAYQDGANGGRTTVMKFDGTDWVPVGPVGFSAGDAPYTTLAFDDSGTAYVAYQDTANSNKATVMKFDGTNWVPVGSVGFSAGDAYLTELAIDGSTPYLAYTDGANGNKATVVMFNGTSWVPVDVAGFTAGEAYVTSLAVDSSNTLYVAYQDIANNRKATVMKYDGTNWVLVGPAGFSAGIAYSITMDLDHAATPYVVYQDSVNGNRATVMKYLPVSLTMATAGNGSGVIIPAAGVHFYGEGDQVTLSAAPNTGSTFTGWTGDPNCASGEVTITADMTCTATFTLDTFTLTSSAGVHGSISPAGAQTVNYGGNLTFTITADPGYAVKDVTVDGISQGAVSSYIFNSIAANHTISASFVKSWVLVGPAGFSVGPIDQPSLAIDGSGTPYVAYSDFGNSGKATVMKFNGGSWTPVGPAGFSSGLAFNTSLAFDASGTPYVAYRDLANEYKATVMKFDGTNWAPVGPVGFSSGGTNEPSLAFDGSGTPYLAYIDYAAGLRVTVMKFDGTNWVLVGSRGFSTEAIYELSLAISDSGTPYVSYIDYINGNKATVMKYDGTDWTPLGGEAASAGIVGYPSLAIDGSGTPYLAYSDYPNNQKSTVMKFDGANWIPVGGVGFSAGPASYLSLVFDGSGTPYLAYSDFSNNRKVTVMKFDGTDWVPVGNASFSAGTASYNSLAIDDSGIPYVAYVDSVMDNKATVMKYPKLTLTMATAGNGSGVVTPAAGIHAYEEGDHVILSAAPSTGSTFTGWTGDPACASGEVTITADMTCTATFTLDTFTITPSAGAHGSISPAGAQTVNYGGGLTFTITPDPGYRIMDVTVDGVSQGAITSYSFSSVNADHTLAATFDLKPPSGLSASNDGPTALGMATSLEASLTEGEEMTYTWDFGDGITRSGPAVTHTYAAAGTYTAKVTASNAVGSLQAETTVYVTTNPIARAESAQKVRTGSSVILDGSASTDPGDFLPLTYQWKQTSGPAVTLTGANSAIAAFHAPTTSQTMTLTFELVVTNVQGLESQPRVVVVTVEPYQLFLPIFHN